MPRGVDSTLPPWTLFQWGSRGLHYTTGVGGIYVAHIFIPNGIRAVLRGHASEGQLLEHVFFFRAASAHPSVSDTDAVCSVVATWWSTQYRNMCNTGVEATDVTATGVDAAPAAQSQVVVGTTGARVGLFISPGATLAIKAVTHVSGRRNRGGKRPWPAVSTDLLAPGNDRYTDAYRTAIVGVFQNLVASAGTAGYPLCFASYADVALKQISTFVAVDDYQDGMDRRLLGRGR